jgi:disease resistance protein RPM1
MVDPCFLSKHSKLLIPVGIEEAIDELTDRLSEGDNVSERKPKVLSIFGGGGLGKTTLAKAVYAKLNKKFDCGGFVRVGTSPDTEKVLRDILHELGKKRSMNVASSEMDVRELSDELKEFIADRRYALTYHVLVNAYFMC